MAFADPDDIGTVTRALISGGATILPFRVDTEGLRLIPDSAAPTNPR